MESGPCRFAFPVTELRQNDALIEIDAVECDVTMVFCQREFDKSKEG